MDRSLLSANFKRDYVAYSAVVIFFLIISSEVVLAFSIPVLLRQSTLWGGQVVRQKMIDSFDNLRGRVRVTKITSGDASEEIKVIGACANAMANYLRGRESILSRNQIDLFAADIDALGKILAQITKDKKPFCRGRTLDGNAFTETLTRNLEQAASSVALPSKRNLP